MFSVMVTVSGVQEGVKEDEIVRSSVHILEFETLEEVKEWIDSAPTKKHTIEGPDIYITVPKR